MPIRFHPIASTTACVNAMSESAEANIFEAEKNKIASFIITALLIVGWLFVFYEGRKGH